jgi:Carboxypeptidase regulatory-like domain
LNAPLSSKCVPARRYVCASCIHLDLQSLTKKIFFVLTFALFELGLRAGAGGSISGTVVDPLELAAANTTVTATRLDTNVRLTVKTGSRGMYSFPDLAVGTYDLEFESAGFRTTRRTHLVVDANSALRVDIRLSLGDRSERISVSASEIKIETVDTQSSRCSRA